jgi:hypothetical protein
MEHVREIAVINCYRYGTVPRAPTPWLPYRVITHYPVSISIYDYPVMGNVQLKHQWHVECLLAP